jgi:spermidine synthase
VHGRFLRGAGVHAEIFPDQRIPGSFILAIGGAEQSHVNLRHPEDVFYEYLRRIANVADLAAPPGTPLRCLHLGAGALTLARYLQATRPGSEQHAVELERELLDFVVDHLPLPEGTDLTVYIGDARQEIAFGDVQGPFDLVVLDIFAGEDAPEHLTTADFYAELLELVVPQGVLLVNVGDDPPLAFAKRQLTAVLETTPHAALLADAAMFSCRQPGNVVVAARHQPWPQEWTAALLAAGPHPAGVLTGPELRSFAG